MKSGLGSALLVLAIVSGCSASIGVRYPSRLWPSRTVYYRFDRTVSRNTRMVIDGAIQQYKDNTCLQFKKTKSRTRSSLLFRSVKDLCYDTKVGYKGKHKDHVVNVSHECWGGISLMSQALHEIGHAIGLVDEYNHPNRSTYAKIRRKAIYRRKKNERFFERVSWKEVDSQGISTFDYKSAMQYGDLFLSKDGKTRTIESRPRFKLVKELSKTDINTLSRMYNCPRPAKKGALRFYGFRGINLFDPRAKDSDVAPAPNSLVRIQTIDADGKKHIFKSQVKENDRNPFWGPISHDFSVAEFQYFRVEVVHVDGDGKETAILQRQFYRIRPGAHLRQLCQPNNHCESRLEFTQVWTDRTDICFPNPCRHGNTCLSYKDEFGRDRFDCECRAGYFGSNCAKRYGHLEVEVTRAFNLSNRDQHSYPEMGHSDVYVSVLAIAHDGTTANGQTATIFDTGNPVWEGRNPSYFPHILDFGVGQWDKIVVQAWDRDSGKTSQQLTKATAKDLQNPLNEKYGRQTSLFCDVPRACRTNPYVEVKVGYYPEVYVEN